MNESKTFTKHVDISFSYSFYIITSNQFRFYIFTSNIFKKIFLTLIIVGNLKHKEKT